MNRTAARHAATTNRDYAVGLGRAFAGAIIFGLPLLMTMEMWSLGQSIDRWRLLQLTLVNMAVLFGLSRVAGFEQSQSHVDDLLDALAAYAVAIVASTLGLFLIGALDVAMPLREIVGKIAIQAIPASFGAMIGARLMGEGDKVEAGEPWRRTYQGQLFLMLAGAMFLSFTMAPTEEILLISFQMTPWHALATVLLSLLLLHLIIGMVGLPGRKRASPGRGLAALTHSLPGFAIAMLVSAYVLWTFGRTAGLDLPHIAMAVAVLGLPAALGAGIARVVV